MLKEYRTSVTNLKLNKKQFKIIDSMSYRAKALYNSALYEINKYYEDYKNGKRISYFTKKGTKKEKGSYIGFQDLDLRMKHLEENTIYRALPAQMSQQILKKIDKNYSSYFKLLSAKRKKTYNKPVKIPKYKKKEDRKELIFAKQSFIIENGYILVSVTKDLSKKRLKLCKVPKYIDGDIKYLEIVPKLGRYELQITYEKEIKEPNKKAENWISIDLGVNNLLTCTSNILNAFMLNGRHIKSINQKYNKKIAKLKSLTKKSQGVGTSKKIQQLYNKRGYKLNSEIHKITSFLVKIVQENEIDHVVIGYNKKWKQSVNLGTKTNQNFVQIPFAKILQQLQYKLKEIGIEVYLQQESYTSKCSYFDNEEVKIHTTYKGKRNNRGLFITSKGIRVNADVNGSLNIYRKFVNTIKLKVVHDVLNVPVDTGLVMNPIKISNNTSMSNSDIRSKLLLIKKTIKN